MKKNMIYHYFNFIRRYAQFNKIDILCQNILMIDFQLTTQSIEQLVELNKERCQIAMKIGEINKNVEIVCCKCSENSCCLGNYNHSTIIDYWLRKFSDSPLEAFNIEMHSPFFVKLFRDRINLNIFSHPKVNRSGCPQLSQNGCMLDIVHRPIKCLFYTCTTFRKSLNHEKLKLYKKYVNDLYIIFFKAFCIIKKEASLSNSYGLLSLFCTF